MKGKVTITKHGYEQTALAAWRQVTGGSNATIVEGTKLSDRTVAAAIAPGQTVSAGSAAVIALYTGLSSTTVYEGEVRKAWAFDFDKVKDIDEVTP